MNVAKIIKRKKNYIDQSYFEIYVLQFLKNKGDPNIYKFLNIQDYFYYNN